MVLESRHRTSYGINARANNGSIDKQTENIARKSCHGVKLPKLPSPTFSETTDGVNNVNATLIPADEVRLKRQRIKHLMTKKEERKGIISVISDGKTLCDIMEDESHFAQTEDDVFMINVKSPKSMIDEEGAVSNSGCDNGGRNVYSADSKVRRRVRFSLPGMGGKCLFPARVEEELQRVRRFSTPSMVGNLSRDESSDDTTCGEIRRTRKSSLPPINYTVETFYESQVKSVDKLVNSLVSRDTPGTPREDSATKNSSLGSAHFLAAMKCSSDSDDVEDDSDDSEDNIPMEEDRVTTESPLQSINENTAILTPSPLMSISSPRVPTPRRRRMGVVNYNTGTPQDNTFKPVSRMSNGTPDSTSRSIDARDQQLTNKNGSSSNTNNIGSPESRSPRNSLTTPPKLLKRRAVSLGQNAKPDLAALEPMSKSSSFTPDSAKDNVNREQEMKNLESKLGSLRIRKREIKSYGNVISESLSPLQPERQTQRSFRTRRKSLPSTMPPSPVLITPEIDFASLENCRYLRRKPSDEDIEH
ncbi:uncharacterized protein LOC102805147 [Saccoglossus kowalevskii]|uniref:Uncharacterized protein LOC102805147 n=1 Tax=Saccoglossus kowalevskii TaxID=10224 RepID=A0ABM0M0R8_SACKO|nr:PREDICTED: uncharacterized protein LOC102805147 [Saccoglossus kowalevskii]